MKTQEDLQEPIVESAPEFAPAGSSDVPAADEDTVMKDTAEPGPDEAISLPQATEDDDIIEILRPANRSDQSGSAADNGVEDHDGTLQDLLGPLLSATLDAKSTASIDLGNSTLLNRKKKLDDGTSPPPDQVLGSSAEMPFDFSSADFDFEGFTAQQLALLQQSETPGPTGNSRRQTPRQTPGPHDPDDFSWMNNFTVEEEDEANDEELTARYASSYRQRNQPLMILQIPGSKRSVHAEEARQNQHGRG